MQITLGNSHAPCTQPFFTWPLHVTSPRDPCTWPLYSSTHSQSWVNWAPLYGFAESATSSECQRSVVSACDISHDFFRSRWASPFSHLVILVLLLGWPFYKPSITAQNRIARSKTELQRSFVKEKTITLGQVQGFWRITETLKLFVDDIWSKIRKNSQWQIKIV